jgi:ribosome recycling factor
VNPNQLVDEAKNKLTQAKNHLEEELKKLRTGRAHPSMLDGLNVKAYGSTMPLNQLSNITAPE